ncbi:glycoside/pentoside/hexuronide:cation symporter, GPH family [Sphingomonas gellani]|uniref:Glycoside/pentoside/hexuronide:cation symporter, GPH family n=1 Tax=Sphingomonas gellani TaxID=1166340 RepID=A0A1H7ZHZ6_9SPHN|nr:MFS transporter [Sphingomonas gellani]SEM57047.1 glycoside/pentoside/hexuronide:cation symporter, GPH family [Sphingomonas gellani]
MSEGQTGTPAGAATSTPSVDTATLVLFGAGDFAFNLYWQAIGFFLLFFYIDVMALPPSVAGTVFMLGAVWDGVADFAAGASAERLRMSYRRLIGWGAVPLGLAFAAMFAVPAGAAAWALAAQVVFRTLYAFTNIPYAAWTARLTTTSRERSLLAGLRMGFGSLAAVLVAVSTPHLVRLLGGYGGATAVLAAIGTPLLLVMTRRVPEPQPSISSSPAMTTRDALALLVRNRAFVAVNLATAAAGAAAALTSQSVLYYFRYVLRSGSDGPNALAGMAAVGLVAVPLWTALARTRGARWAWLAAAVLALVVTLIFAVYPAPSRAATAAFLLLMQAAFAGFSLASWTLLPDTVEWGEAHGGHRVEALAFGTFALVQKVALAGAGFAIGAIYQAGGFVAGAAQGPSSLAAIRWVMLTGPALLVTAMLVAVIAIPLRRDTLAVLRRA